MQSDPNYERDFYKWAFDQAALLRAGKLDEADIENIAEEIESLGRIEKRELVNRLTILLVHQLKWDLQPLKQAKSWESTIKEQRLKLAFHLEDNPSLRAKLEESLEKAYAIAVLRASRETGLAEDSFPQINPYSVEDALGMTAEVATYETPHPHRSA